MPLWLVHGTHFEQQELSCWMCVHVYVFTNASVHVHNPAMVRIALSKDGLCGWIWRLEINLTSLVQPLSALIFETRSLTFTYNFNSARLTGPRDPTVSASSVLGFHEFWDKSLGKFLTDRPPPRPHQVISPPRSLRNQSLSHYGVLTLSWFSPSRVEDVSWTASITTLPCWLTHFWALLRPAL